MRFTFTLVIALFAFTSVFAQGENAGINFFNGTWNETLAEAKKAKKPIFVDAYAVWCGPCKWMDKNVFTDQTVGAYFNDNYINYKFDMEKGEGPVFARQYSITAYPTLLFIDEEGKVVHRVMGARTPDQFILEGQRAMSVR